jgi:hypothetical protein
MHTAKEAWLWPISGSHAGADTLTVPGSITHHTHACRLSISKYFVHYPNRHPPTNHVLYTLFIVVYSHVYHKPTQTTIHTPSSHLSIYHTHTCTPSPRAATRPICTPSLHSLFTPLYIIPRSFIALCPDPAPSPPPPPVYSHTHLCTVVVNKSYYINRYYVPSRMYMSRSHDDMYLSSPTCRWCNCYLYHTGKG